MFVQRVFVCGIGFIVGSPPPSSSTRAVAYGTVVLDQVGV